MKGLVVKLSRFSSGVRRLLLGNIKNIFIKYLPISRIKSAGEKLPPCQYLKLMVRIWFVGGHEDGRMTSTLPNFPNTSSSNSCYVRFTMVMWIKDDNEALIFDAFLSSLLSNVHDFNVRKSLIIKVKTFS